MDHQNRQVWKCFCKNVQHYRKERGFTQKELSLKMGANRTYICALEQGRGNPTIRSIMRISQELKIDPMLLFYPHNNKYQKVND